MGIPDRSGASSQELEHFGDHLIRLQEYEQMPAIESR